MTILKYFLILVEVVSAFLLIGVILIQKTKSQGMGLAFGAGMGESLFGSQVGNVLTKVTVILAVIFMVNTTALALLGSGRGTQSVTEKIEAPAPAPAPAGSAKVPTGVPAGGMLPQTPVMEEVSIPAEAAAPEAAAAPVAPATEAPAPEAAAPAPAE